MPTLTCHQCQQPLRVADTAIGQRIKCPKCGTIFVATVPAAAATPAAVQPSAPPRRPAAPPSPERIAARPAAAAPRPPKSSGESFEDLAPAAPTAGKSRSAKSGLTFLVAVKSDPKKSLKGRYQGSLTSEGLHLRQGSKPALLIPRGTAAEYQGGNRLSVEVEGRPVQLQIMKRISYQNRLTEDIAGYLNGDTASLPLSNYTLPWYYMVLVLLPLGIPIVSLGGALPCLLGGGLCGLNAAIVQREKWPGVLRGLLSAGLALLGYVGLGIVVLATALLSWFRGIDAAEWKPFTPPDGSCTILMPGVPTTTREPVPGLNGPMLDKHLVEVPRHNAVFVLAWIDLPNWVVQRHSLTEWANLERDEIVRRMNGKLVGERDLVIDGRPTREFQIEASGSRAIERVFQVPTTPGRSRLYMLMAGGTRYTPDSGDAKKFFDSFQHLAPSSKPPVPADNPLGPPKPPPPPPPPPPSLDDLKPGPDIPRFYTAVVDPENHFALFVEGQQLLRCDYPDFKKKDSYSLGEFAGYASVLDRAGGLLYLAVSKPGELQGTHPNQRLLGMGDIQVHNVQALQEGKVKAGAVLQPEAVLKLGKKIARLLLSPDGHWLYYLDVTDGKSPKIGRIDARLRQPAGETAVLEGCEDMSLTSDGKTLYAAGRPAPGKGSVQVLDPDGMKVRKEVPLPGAPYGIAATDGDLVYVALLGQWTEAVGLDVRTGVVAAHLGGLFGRCFLQLAPDQKRVYVAITELSPTSLQAWKLPEKPGDKPQKAGDQSGGATPQFVITPDGRFLLNRAGKSFRLAGSNEP